MYLYEGSPDKILENLSLEERINKMNDRRDMQLRDGEKLKWNTHDEAYQRAAELVG